MPNDDGEATTTSQGLAARISTSEKRLQCRHSIIDKKLVVGSLDGVRRLQSIQKSAEMHDLVALGLAKVATLALAGGEFSQQVDEMAMMAFRGSFGYRSGCRVW